MNSTGKLLYPILFFWFVFMMACARIDLKEPKNVQTGLASWYGSDFHGKTTSNQEVYNMYDLTAAHRSLPFGTWVMVTNLKNGKSVTVRINDRGPFVRGRIIDLSYAAAAVIDAVEPGIIPVKLEILEDISPSKRTQTFVVQVGSFVSKANAKALAAKLKKTYAGVQVTTYNTATQTYYRVRIKAHNQENAENIARQLASEGVSSYVIEL